MAVCDACGRPLPGHKKGGATCKAIASALRAQYVAGLERALTEARALGRSRTEVAEAIHGLAEQAKRE